MYADLSFPELRMLTNQAWK